MKRVQSKSATIMSEKPGKSTLVVKLVIRGDNFELSTEGPLEGLSKEVGSIIAFRDQLGIRLGNEKGASRMSDRELSRLSREAKPSAGESMASQVTAANVPVITASKSGIKNIEALFSTSWGKSPRTTGEILKALDVNAASDRPQSVSRDLIRLTQRGILRRIRREGNWTYFRIPGDK